MYDTIVVGGGITGLQLGALLANDGENVLVLEKSSHLGGRAAIVKKEGYTLDYGIHVVRFGPKSALAETCRRLGREVEFIPLGSSYVKDHDGVIKLFPTGPKAFLTSKLFTFSERLKILRWMIKLRKADHSALVNTSVAQWMHDHNFSGGLRRYFHMVSASMLVCPFIEKASAGELLINMQKVLQVGISVMYPRGGWEPLFDLFSEKIRANGEVRTGAAVEKLAVEGETITGVFVKGELLPARKVVLSLPALELDQLLVGVADDPFINLCRSTRPTAGIVLEYGIKEPVSAIAGLVYLYEPMSFGMFTSNLEPSLAPLGKQLLTWLQPLPEAIFGDKEALKAREQELEQALFDFFPGLAEKQEWRRVMHLPVMGGVEVNTSQTADRRPSFRVPGLQNLFLVGDSTASPGAGGDIGHESVHLSYNTIKAASV